MASAVEPSSNSGSVDPATAAARHVPDHDVTEKRARAAQTIQRTYRGYRTRRELHGLDLSASTSRWKDVGFFRTPAVSMNHAKCCCLCRWNRP
ncbi:hypothetical protein BO85DRAFT_248519 [Aspergillus piperis CBS 112811]|uniref:Uncharacterized protein n=1 Tax=Aspergillus piperis CBS 112811 TaxID=1448313 RepID=A0A8G1VPC6_9EURO|nr:hypothetical protein BO85DRAFT_248519 [Aspergillus piperis CBS 112811]RAH59705.1 hypothetical protein BO85DRAFT_248519 [Aspergillus piperis CBS 112811]